MPTYQYRCSHCNNEFEEFQSMKDAPLVTCPQCNEDRLYRVIGAGGGMIFKGSGFYLTDYGKNSSAKGGSTSSEKKSETKKTDSAPAKQ